MFENTETELSQCVANMEEAATFEDLDLNQYERTAFLRMRELCREFLAEHDRLLESMQDE
jgi:hypothetical protein